MAARLRDDRRAGFYTLLVLTVGSAALITLPRRLGERPIEYRLLVDSSTDLTGLAIGAPVQVGGLERGRVLSITPEQQPDGRQRVLVRIELRRFPPIFPGASAVLRKNPISQVSSIDFQSVGQRGGGGNGDPLAADSLLVLREPTEVESILGGSMGQSFDLIRSRVQDTPTQFGAISDDASRRIGELRDAAVDLRRQFNESWPAIVTKGQALIEEYRGLEPRFTTLLDTCGELKKEFDELRAIGAPDGAYARVEASFAELRASWASLREESSSVTTQVDRIRDEWARVVTGTDRLREHVRDIGDLSDFGDITADLSLTSTVFGKLTAEVFTEPWRALLPNESTTERLRGELDELSRLLLRGAEDARVAREAVTRALEVGAMTGERAAAVLDQLHAQFLEMKAFEDAVWRLRFGPDAPP